MSAPLLVKKCLQLLWVLLQIFEHQYRPTKKQWIDLFLLQMLPIVAVFNKRVSARVAVDVTASPLENDLSARGLGIG